MRAMTSTGSFSALTPNVRRGPTPGLPVLVENRPEHLVEILAVLEERLAQHALLHGADLPQRAVAAAVLEPPRAPRADARRPSRTRSRPSVQLLPGTRRCPRTADPIANPHSAVPKPGSSSRSWKMPIAVSMPVERDREAGIRAGLALPQRPRDEALEAFNRGRRRRNEPRHFFRRQHREERRRIRRAQLAQRDLRAAQHRQALAPVRADRVSDSGWLDDAPAGSRGRPVPVGRASFPWLEPSEQQ